MAEIRPLRPGDIEHVAARLREADRQELIAAEGRDRPTDALCRAVLMSSDYWAFADHEPIAIFGAMPLSLLGGVGAPWLLGTDRLFRFPGALVREGRRYVQRMLAVYPHLVNYVDARNTRSVRWLGRIGFSLHPPAPYGAQGLPFHKFEMRA